MFFYPGKPKGPRGHGQLPPLVHPGWSFLLEPWRASRWILLESKHWPTIVGMIPAWFAIHFICNRFLQSLRVEIAYRIQAVQPAGPVLIGIQNSGIVLFFPEARCFCRAYINFQTSSFAGWKSILVTTKKKQKSGLKWPDTLRSQLEDVDPRLEKAKSHGTSNPHHCGPPGTLQIVALIGIWLAQSSLLRECPYHITILPCCKDCGCFLVVSCDKDHKVSQRKPKQHHWWREDFQTKPTVRYLGHNQRVLFTCV